MTTKVLHDCKLLGLTSDWVEDVQLKIRTRQIKDKILVDITELTHSTFCDDGVTLGIAMRSARRFGAASVDCTELRPFEAHKETEDLNGNKLTVYVKHSCFIFKEA